MSVFNQIPNLLLTALTAVLVVLSIEAGLRLGNYLKNRQKLEPGASVGALVGVQLTILAFLIGFTFSYSAGRFSERRVLMIAEANSIGTTYLRSDFMPEANGKVVRDALRQYVTLRLQLTHDYRIKQDPKIFEAALEAGQKLQHTMWAQTLEMAKARDSALSSSFITSMNETIDLQAKRVAAERYSQLPDMIWFMLYALLALGMFGLGYQLGVGSGRSWVGSSILAFSFAMIMGLLVDLDRPTEGFLLSNQRPLIDLAKQIGAPPITE